MENRTETTMPNGEATIESLHAERDHQKAMVEWYRSILEEDQERLLAEESKLLKIEHDIELMQISQKEASSS